jgi:hypothetical protein
MKLETSYGGGGAVPRTNRRPSYIRRGCSKERKDAAPRMVVGGGVDGVEMPTVRAVRCPRCPRRSHTRWDLDPLPKKSQLHHVSFYLHIPMYQTTQFSLISSSMPI